MHEDLNDTPNEAPVKLQMKPQKFGPMNLGCLHSVPQNCVNVTPKENNCQLSEETFKQVTNNNLTFLCTRRTISFNSTSDPQMFVQLVNVKLMTRKKGAAVMTTLVIQKMDGVLLKIWKSQGALNI